MDRDAVALVAGLAFLVFAAVSSRVGPMARRMGSETVRLPEEVAHALARRDVTKGLAWAAGGGILTGITYLAASGGGTYFLAWGPIAYGALLLIRGAWRYFTHV